MCLLALVLIEIAHYSVGTTLGHHGASFFGWLIALAGVIVSAVGLRFRSACAFLLAPGVGVVVADIVWQTFHYAYPSPNSSEIGFVIILLPLTYAVAAAVGIPSILILDRIGWRRMWHYVIAAMVVGSASGLMLAFALTARAEHTSARGGLPFYYPLDLCVLLGLLASVSAYLFYWLIAVPRKPPNQAMQRTKGK